MIQRIQTIYLLLAAAIMSLLFLPTFEFLGTDNVSQATIQNQLMTDGLFNSFDNIILVVLIGTIAATLFLNIFLFKNRKLQILVSRIAFIGALSVILVAGVLFYQNSANFEQEMTFVQVRLGLIVPVICMILIWLAIRNLNKDERIVKSMDRLR